jgi:hypothetical protein
MSAQALVERLERFPPVLLALCGPLTPQAARWRPRPGAWSALEVLGHIEEEERRDFRPRIESTLRDPREPWAPIDPQAWVREHAYQERDQALVLREFAQERAHSVQWLRSLDAPDWDAAHDHPSLGRLRAGDLLAAWTAHDALHLRQLTRLLYEGVVVDADPYTCSYAGPWT